MMSQLDMKTFHREISLDSSFSRRRKNKPKQLKTNIQQTNAKNLNLSVCGDESSNEFVDVMNINAPSSPLEVSVDIYDLMPQFENVEINSNSSIHKQSNLNFPFDNDSHSKFRITDSVTICESKHLHDEVAYNEGDGFSQVFSPNRTKQDVNIPVCPDDIIDLDRLFEKSLKVSCEKLDLEQFCLRNQYKRIGSDTVVLKTVSTTTENNLDFADFKIDMKKTSVKKLTKSEDKVPSTYISPTIIRCNPVTSTSTCTKPIVIWPAGTRSNLESNFSNVNTQTINISNNCSFSGQSTHTVNISNDHRNIEYNPICNLQNTGDSSSIQNVVVNPYTVINNDLDIANSSIDDAIIDALDLSNLENDENMIEVLKGLNNLFNSTFDFQNTNLFFDKASTNNGNGENLSSALATAVSSQLLNSCVNSSSLHVSGSNESSHSSNSFGVASLPSSHSKSSSPSLNSESNILTSTSDIHASIQNSTIPITSTPINNVLPYETDIELNSLSSVKTLKNSDMLLRDENIKEFEKEDKEEYEGEDTDDLENSEEQRLINIKKEMESFMLSAKPSLSNVKKISTPKRQKSKAPFTPRRRFVRPQNVLPNISTKSNTNPEFNCSKYNAELNDLLFGTNSDMFSDNFEVDDFSTQNTPEVNENTKLSTSNDFSSKCSSSSSAKPDSTIADESSLVNASNILKKSTSATVSKHISLDHSSKCQNESSANEFICSIVKGIQSSDKKHSLKSSNYRSPIRIRVSRSFPLNFKRSKDKIKKRRRKKLPVSVGKTNKYNKKLNEQTFSDDTVLNSKKKPSLNQSVKHIRRKDKSTNASKNITDFNTCSENESLERKNNNVTGNSFASRSREIDEQYKVEKTPETIDNKTRIIADIESTESDEDRFTKKIHVKRKKGKRRLNNKAALNNKQTIARRKNIEMEDTDKITELSNSASDDHLNKKSDLKVVSSTEGYLEDVDSEMSTKSQDNKISSQNDTSVLSNKEDSSNEMANASQNLNTNAKEVDLKDEGQDLSELLPKISNDEAAVAEILNINSSCDDIEFTDECNVSDSDISNSEIFKHSANESVESLTEKSEHTNNEMELCSDQKLDKDVSDMEVDSKECDENVSVKKQSTNSLESGDLGDKTVLDDALERKNDDASLSNSSHKENLNSALHKTNESLSLEKDMDSTNDSQILERDLKLSDDSSDNLIINEDELKTNETVKKDLKESVSENISKSLETEDLKSFESTDDTVSKIKLTETSENNETNPHNVLSEKNCENIIDKNSTVEVNDKNPDISRTNLTDKKSQKKKNTKLTISAEKSVNNELSNVNISTPSELDSSSSLSSVKRTKKSSYKGVNKSEQHNVLKTSISKSKGRHKKLSTSSKSKAVNPSNTTTENNNLNKEETSKLPDISMAIETKVESSLSDLLNVETSNVAEDLLSSGKSKSSNSSHSNTTETLNQAPAKDTSQVLIDEKLPQRITSRTKVKKRPYSPESTPPPVASRSSSKQTPRISSPASARVNSPASARVNSPASAARKKSKKYNEEDVLVPFKSGWMRELVHRSSTAGKAKASDIYYFTPEGNKLRSMPEISKYLIEHEGHGLTIDNFTFAKETIYRSPFERERDANVKSNILKDTPVAKTPPTGKKKITKKSSEPVLVTDSPVGDTAVIDKPKPTVADTSNEKIIPVKNKKIASEKPKPAPKSAEKRVVKTDISVEKRKAEPESNNAANRTTRLKSTDSTTSDSSVKDKDSLNKTPQRSKSAKLSSSSDSTTKLKKKIPLLKVKFTKNYNKGKTTTVASIRGAGGDIEDDLHRILTTPISKTSKGETNKKNTTPKSSQQKKKKKK